MKCWLFIILIILHSDSLECNIWASRPKGRISPTVPGNSGCAALVLARCCPGRFLCPTGQVGPAHTWAGAADTRLWAVSGREQEEKKKNERFCEYLAGHISQTNGGHAGDTFDWRMLTHLLGNLVHTITANITQTSHKRPTAWVTVLLTSDKLTYLRIVGTKAFT